MKITIEEVFEAYYECRKTELMKIFILYVILYFEKINFGVARNK